MGSAPVMRVSADQAAAAVRSESAVRIPGLPPEALKQGTYKIFNILAKYHQETTGVGPYFIPDCEYGFVWEPTGDLDAAGCGIYEKRKAKDGEISYSRPCQVKHVIYYGIRKEIETIDWRQESGRAVCADILGIAQSHPMIGIPNGLGYKHKSQDLTEEGVFLAAGDTPTKKELETAFKLLSKKMRALRDEGDKEYRKGPGNYENIGEIHRTADSWLVEHGLSVPADWNKEIISSMACPGCGETVNPNVAIHLACGAIINEEKYSKLKFAPGSRGAASKNG